MLGLIVLGVILLAGIFVAGNRAGRGSSTEDTQDIWSDYDNLTSNGDCDLACKNLVLLHSITCQTKTDAYVASLSRDAVIAELGRAIAASAVLLAAAIATGFVPIIGSILAVPIWTAWVTSHLYVDYLLGQLSGADARARHYNQVWIDATVRETKAVIEVTTECSADKAAACLAKLQPCPTPSF